MIILTLTAIKERIWLNMVSSGINIDCKYLLRVKDHIPIPLPRPRKKPPLHDIDGKPIPIITVTIGAFEWQNTFIETEQKNSKNYHDISTKEKTDGSKSAKESAEHYSTGEASPH